VSTELYKKIKLAILTHYKFFVNFTDFELTKQMNSFAVSSHNSRIIGKFMHCYIRDTCTKFLSPYAYLRANISS
jgi:hypothetical protein